MRSKSLKRFFGSFAGLFLSASAFAQPTVAPALPYTTITNSGDPAVYFPSKLLPTTYYLGTGFSDFDFDTTGTTTNLTFTVAGVANNLMIFAEDPSGNTPVKVPLYYCNIGLCSPGPTSTTPIYALGAGGQTLTVGLNPASICSQSGGAGIRGCVTSGMNVVVDQASTPVPGFRLRFVDTTETNPDVLSSDTRKAGTLLAVFPEIKGPVVTNCPATPGFFPADSAIVVDTGQLLASVATGSLSSPSFTGVKVVFNKDSDGGLTNATDYTTLDPTTHTRLVGYGAGSVTVDGFDNSTDASGGDFYHVDYGVQDSAGVIAFCGQNPGGTSFTDYPLGNVFATDIQGFLRESNCFVATASFRNGRAPMVMLLRRFRDEILVNYELGRDFVAWYYENGPIAADWLIAHPAFRAFSLALLIPLEAIAWAALHPSVLWIPFGALLVFALFFFRRRAILLLAIFVLGLPSARAEDAQSQTPYIDSLISEVPNDYHRTNENPDPYIQTLKKNISPDDTTGYSEFEQKKLGPDGSAGYAEKIQRELPPDNRSAIQDYKNGRKLKPNKGDLTTASAFGFQIAASMNRTYTSANQEVAYDSVYGSGWIPDFKLHYEMRPFPRTDFIGKLGLYGSAGVSFTKAQGLFDFTNNGQFGDRSLTQFTFIMIPVNVGAIYRMNWGVIFPYFGAGPSMIGVIEKRSDEQPSHHGYSFGYWFMGGVSFGLDSLFPKNSWDQYETAAVKHSYLSIEYSYLSSLSGGIIDMTVDGVEVGFTFEL